MSPRPLDSLATTSAEHLAWPGLPLADDFDMDLFLVEIDRRELGKWEGVAERSVPAHEERARRSGLRSRIVRGPSPGRSVVFFARREDTLERAERLELEYRATRSYAARAPSSRALGEMLGYPPCCVEAWATGPQDDERALKRLGADLTTPMAPMLNFFPRHIAPVGFLPCDRDCRHAIDHAERVAGDLEKHHGIERAALERALRGVVLWESGPFFLMFRDVSALGPHGFRFESVATPVESPHFPDDPDLRVHVERIQSLATTFRSGSRVDFEDARVSVRGSTGSRTVAEGSLRGRFMVFGP